MLYILTVVKSSAYFVPLPSTPQFMSDFMAEHIEGAFRAAVVKHETLTQWEQDREEFIPTGISNRYRRVVTTYLDTSYETWCEMGINHKQIDEGEGVFTFERDIIYNVWLLDADTDVESGWYGVRIQQPLEDYYYSGERIPYFLVFDS